MWGTPVSRGIMNSSIKGLTIGLFISLGLGVVGYYSSGRFF
jgi:hypothetical protein